MNSIKYRKWYLQENWGENKFIMIKENVDSRFCPYKKNFQVQHPKILSGEAFWTTRNKLCIGYHSVANPDIFRPIFSHKRQRLLDDVHGKNEEHSVYNPNFSYARKKYLVAFNEYIYLNHKLLPMDCVEIILSFINQYL